jgi:hypothetical protein
VTVFGDQYSIPILAPERPPANASPTFKCDVFAMVFAFFAFQICDLAMSLRLRGSIPCGATMSARLAVGMEGL